MMLWIKLVEPRRGDTDYEQDEDFHGVIAESYECKITIATSPLAVTEWSDAFHNRILGTATIDRLRHSVHKIFREGKATDCIHPGSGKQHISCQRTENQTTKGGPITRLKGMSENHF
ncbi:MAG: ATP-binding protein [Syntrophales bacterium]|nr:ATP-binding protein [Syntrophales bacterium]